ncbi:MAG TPA: methyltransferase dimerization domain-containing protein [Nitrospira sp.]|nr:methyltransferase dimerization domain-containing protein [Nitrospira sp.]
MVSPADRGHGVTPRISTFEAFRDAVSGYRLPRVLLAGLELDLFTAVGARTWTIPELARALKVSERGLAILCRNLAMAGLLHKKGETYRNGRLAATALNANHRAYRGGYLDLIKSHWMDWFRCWNPCAAGCRSTMMSRTATTIDAGLPGLCITAPWRGRRRSPRS